MSNEQQQPLVTHTQTYAYCTGTRHPTHKRIAVFSDRGLIQWCKACHAEIVVSWEELDAIRQRFQQHQHQQKY